VPVPVSSAFGDVVRELRLRRGLSQEALSFACGRHRTYVSLLERGRSSPTLDTLWMLAAALGVKPAEIVSRVERRAGTRPPPARARAGRSPTRR
jgi:transcriptional regulator with XRE-family HTH domain